MIKKIIRKKIAFVAVFIVFILTGCSEDKVTGPDEFTIDVPADSTGDVTGGPWSFRDLLVVVRDGNGIPANKVAVQIYATGSAFGAFYTDFTLTALRSDPYEDITDKDGVIKINIASSAFVCVASGDEHSFGFNVKSGTESQSFSHTMTCL